MRERGRGRGGRRRGGLKRKAEGEGSVRGRKYVRDFDATFPQQL